MILGEEFVADEGSVYYRDNDSTLYALDLDSGAQRWTTASAERSSSNVEVNGDNLLFASTVYSLKTQKVEVDFLATEFPFGRRTSEVLLSQGALKELNRATAPGQYVVYDARTGSCAIEELGILAAMHAGDGKSLLGYRGKSLALYDFEARRIQWSIDLAAGDSLIGEGPSRHCTSRHVALGFPEKNIVHILDRHSGELLATHHLTGVDKNLDTYGFSTPIFARDTFHLLTFERLVSCDTNTGRVLWMHELKREHFFCGAGDLIFGIINDKEIVGWDRYSGEELWRSSHKNWPFTNIKASGNKLMVDSNAGKLLCFEWDTPYISPHRPKP